MPDFDPYHKWFAIKPAQQPPNFYRLLGVELYESDPDVIDTAADQRMTFLQTCANGEHVALSQKMMNEVSNARVALLNDEKRAAYDKRLRAKLNPKPTVSIKTDPTKGAVSRAKKKSSLMPLAIGGGVVGVIVIVAIVMLAGGNDDSLDEQPQKQVAAKSGDSKSNNVGPLIAAKTPAAKSATTKSVSKTGTVISAKTPEVTPVDPNASTSSGLIPELDFAGLGEPDDLLNGIDPVTHSMYGKWTRTDDELRNSEPEGGRIVVPVALPKEFNLRIVTEGISEKAGLAIRFAGDGQKFMTYLDGVAPNRDRFYGLARVDGLEPHRNSTSKRKTNSLTDGESNTVDLAVREGHVTVAVNGNKIIDWTGDPSQLSLGSKDTDDSGDLQIFALGGELRISRIELRSPVGSNPTTQPPDTSPELKLPENAIDLLARVNPARDQLCGRWQFEDGDLTCTDTYFERLVLARDVPLEYDLYLKLQPVSGRAFIGMQLPYVRHPLSFYFNHSNSAQPHLSRPYGADTKIGHFSRIFRNSVATNMKISVTTQQITVTIDGKEEFGWRGSQLLSFARMQDVYRWPIAGAITLESYDSSVRFLSAHLVPTKRPVAGMAGWREPPPSEAESTAKVRELLAAYRAKITAARDAGAKNRLVEELRTAARTEFNATARFALLSIARSLARQATTELVGFASMNRVLDDIEMNFVIQPAPWQLDDANHVSQQRLSPTSLIQLAHFCREAADGAIRQDDYATAAELLDVATRALRKGKFTGASRALDKHIDRVKTLQQAFEGINQSVETLQAQPSDRDALRTLADFYCFTKEDWANGLVYLRSINDPKLSPIADREIAAGNTHDRLVDVALEWANVATTDSSNEAAIKRHAAELAHRVLPFVDELGAAKIQKLVTPEYLESRGVLAEDMHLGVAGNRHTRNSYVLSVEKPTSIGGTTLRILMYAGEKRDSQGTIEVSADGENWTHLASWTQRVLLDPRRADTNWLSYAITADSPVTRLSRLHLRFRFSKGADALAVRHVLWTR